MSTKQSAYIESYEAYLIHRKALTATLKPMLDGPGYDDDGNKLSPDYAPLIALFTEFKKHYRPYILRNNTFEDTEYELLEQMLDVQDVGKRSDIMDELHALYHPAFDWNDENTW